MEKTILVVGGTGMLGRPVAERLAADGFRVRVLTRRPREAETVFGARCALEAGDVEDPAAVARALDGCAGLHLSLNGGADPDLERRGALVATRLAAAKGIGRITLLSGASVAEGNCWFPGTKAKWEAEAAVRGSGVPHAIFRATFFMESLPRYVRGSRASVIGDQPKRWHWVAAEDFAGMVSRAHAETRESGVFPVLGPEAMTTREALARYCALCVPGAKTGVLPFWMAGLLARMPGGDELRTALPFFRYTSRVGENPLPSGAVAPFGAAATTLEAWCRGRAGVG